MFTNKVEFDIIDLDLILKKSNNVVKSRVGTLKGVSTDTRTLEPGNIFIALKGESYDAHNNIPEAFSKKASCAIVNQNWYENNLDIAEQYPLYIVSDTIEALGQLAQHHRRKFDIPIIAVAGSNGKTTTKEMISHLLSMKYKVLKTYHNYNNQIGVPMMLFQLDDNYDIAVIEIGTNEPGEIAILSNILEPTHGIITNIGKEHLEKLINLDGVELEETFLFGHLLKKDGVAFVNNDDIRLKKYSKILENKLTFGSDESSDFKASYTLNENLNPIIEFNVEDRKLSANLNTIGKTTALNAIASASVAYYFGLSDEEIKSGLESFVIPEGNGYGRMFIQKANWGTLINDCYNANPESMKAALFTLKEFKNHSKKIAVLGDMRELGEHSHQEHIEILKIASDCADYVYIVGSEMQKAFLETSFINIEIFDSKSDIVKKLRNIKLDNSVLLVKASRGMKMEEVIKEVLV